MNKTSASKIISKSYYEKVYYSDVTKLSEKLGNRLHFYRRKKILGIYSPGPTEVVADLGSAWGELCFAMANKCRTMIGVDFSEKVVRFCSQLASAKNKDPSKSESGSNPGENPRSLYFLCADAQYTGIKSDSLDVAISADLFEHLYPEQFLRSLDECRRILKPGGRLIIWTPHRGHIIEVLKNNAVILKPDPAHVDYKSMELMKTELRKRNFSILKSYYAESHLPVFNVIEKMLLPFLPMFRRRIAILAKKMPD
jgi:SAM-dependent methyltransferase